jgi:hypothetical protein
VKCQFSRAYARQFFLTSFLVAFFPGPTVANFFFNFVFWLHFFQVKSQQRLHQAMLTKEQAMDEVNEVKGKKTPPKRPVNRDIREAFGWAQPLNKYGSSNPNQLRWDIEITRLLAACNLPFSLVDHPGFHK